MLDLSSLNDKQYEAVTSSSQNLRIIAGAGSGKTRVLTYRIAYLIEQEEMFPRQIVAFTFTNKAAKEMKERTIKLLEGSVGRNELLICTFHSYCARFLRSEIGVLGFPTTFVIIDEADQKKLFQDVGNQLYGYKKNDPELAKYMSQIAYIKGLGLLPDDAENNNGLFDFKDSEYDKKRRLEIFKAYEKVKNNSFYLDFDDLLIYTNKILRENYDIRLKYVNRYKSILIDEFQDTNDVQYELVKLLSSTATKIFAVGDPDQTIYTWRGANQSIILDLDKDYPNMETIVLNQNYRSTPSILDSANRLISKNTQRYKKDLYTKNEDLNPVTVRGFRTKDDEGMFIARTIQTLVKTKKDIFYSNIAVLYRASYISLKVELALTKLNIPYIVYGGERFYSRMEVKDCLAYIRVILSDKDDISFERIINVPKRGIGDKTISTLKEEAATHNMHLAEYARRVSEFNTKIPGGTIAELNSLFYKIDQTKQELDAGEKKDTAQILEKFFRDKIQYQEYLNKFEDADSRIENVDALMEDISSNFKDPNSEMTLEEYLANIALLSSQDEIQGADAVALMTVHVAKGLEYDYVFVAGFNEDVFPSYKSTKKSELEEERRLAYVAFTRAKKGLYVTYNTEYVYGTGNYGLPSRFIKEAGLAEKKEEKVEPLFVGYNSNTRKYHYRYEDDLVDREPIVKPNPNDIFISGDNGIKWEIGDRCYHDVFHNGTVVDISDSNVLTIDFDSFGTKKILGSHFKLKKIPKDS